MKMLTQSEAPVALVSCWLLGGHLFASHTVYSHTWMFSAPLVGRLGTCRELSHRWCTCHLNGGKRKGLSSLWWKKPEASKSAAACRYRQRCTDLHSPCFSHRCRNQEAPTELQANLQEDEWQFEPGPIQKCLEQLVSWFSQSRSYPWTSPTSPRRQCTGTQCKWLCWRHTCSSWLPPCCQMPMQQNIQSRIICAVAHNYLI